MTNYYQKTEVFKYLGALKDYLEGDVETFKKLCKTLESENLNTIMKVCKNPSNEDSENLKRVMLNNLMATQPSTLMSREGEPQKETLEKPNCFNLTIPITLALFATADYLGYLSGDNNDVTKTEKNFWEFFKFSKDFQPPFVVVSQEESKILTHIFRHGLVHNYFPKLGLPVSYHSENEDKGLFFKIEDRNLTRDVTLNVNKLILTVPAILTHIMKKEILYEKMEIRHQYLQLCYQSQLTDCLKKLTSVSTASKLPQIK